MIYYADSPIVVTTVPTAFAVGTSSRKVVILVKATVNSKVLTERFYIPCETGQKINVDVSSALRKMLGSVELTPNSSADGFTIPEAKFELWQYYVYMEGGVLKRTAQSQLTTKMLIARRGSLTDVEMEAYYIDGQTKNDIGFTSRKPSTGEIGFNGQKYFTLSTEEDVTKSSLNTVDTSKTDVSYPFGYIDSKADDYVEIMYVNSLGYPETVACHTLEEKVYNIEPTAYNRIDSISQRPDMDKQVYIFQKDASISYSLSSGACTREWSEWWSSEFLRSTQYWIRKGAHNSGNSDFDDVWYPCKVEADKSSISVYDATKNDALHVDFTAEIMTVSPTSVSKPSAPMHDNTSHCVMFKINDADDIVYAVTLEQMVQGVDSTTYIRSYGTFEDITTNGVTEHTIKYDELTDQDKKVSTIQQKAYRQFEMSSGNCTREWAEWWAVVFLRATSYKMYIDGNWLPCTVKPKSSKVTVYNRSKDDPLHIDFTVTLGVTI